MRPDQRDSKMRKLFRALFVLPVAAIAFLPVGGAAETLMGQVVRISDGDTLTLLSLEKKQFTIRLSGIDAPERDQDFGRKSAQSLGELVHRKQVTVSYEKHDRYGRIVGKVLAGGTDVNLIQVGRGMAWHYKAYAREQSVSDRASYAAAEEVARAAKAGLWAHPVPVAPWEYRQTKSEAKRKE